MNHREIMDENSKKTKMVVGTYVLIMYFVGLLLDVVLYAPYPNSFINSYLAYLTFKLTPNATFITMAIVGVLVYFLARKGHKMMLMGTNAIHVDPTGDLSDPVHKQLVNIIEEMSVSAGMGYTPKIYIMPEPEPNAFAAGWNTDNAIVGVTQGLLDMMDRAELQAVIAHEIGHVINGDSKLTLYVGVLANVIVTVTDILAHVLWFMGRTNPAARRARTILIIVNFLLPFVTGVLFLFLSRKREYMADATAVRLTGDNQAMITALAKLNTYKAKSDDDDEDEEDEEESSYTASASKRYRRASYIFDYSSDRWFSTHPSIENRIKEMGGDPETHMSEAQAQAQALAQSSEKDAA
jgi:heat shock protein HtpX